MSIQTPWSENGLQKRNHSTMVIAINAELAHSVPNSTITPQDGSHAKRRMGLNREQMEAMNRVSLPGARPTQLSLAPPSASTSASASAATSPSPTPSTPADSGPPHHSPPPHADMPTRRHASSIFF